MNFLQLIVHTSVLDIGTTMDIFYLQEVFHFRFLFSGEHLSSQNLSGDDANNNRRT